MTQKGKELEKPEYDKNIRKHERKYVSFVMFGLCVDVPQNLM